MLKFWRNLRLLFAGSEDIIHERYRQEFAKFIYPFQRSDDLIAGWRQQKKEKYFLEAAKILNSPVFKQELNELCRELYFELAVNKEDRESRLLYKAALLFTHKFYQRIKVLSISDPVEREKAVAQAIEKIKEFIPDN